MKLLYAYSGSPRRRRRQLGSTVDRVLNTRPAWSATKECARLRTATTVDSEPPQTVSTPAGEDALKFLGASEAKTSRSRDDDASMACGFCLLSIIMESTVYVSPGVAFRDWPLNFQPREADASDFEAGR